LFAVLAAEKPCAQHLIKAYQRSPVRGGRKHEHCALPTAAGEAVSVWLQQILFGAWLLSESS
jgi:hypothetical protein